MKALFSIPMLATIATTGIVSCHLFQKAYYGASELLTVTSFLATIFLVNFLTNRKSLAIT
ncbi:MAG: hypothetical protein P4L51_12630 [Puia sp.]|nr:hypothetical protein [Puia sp.]